MQRCNDALPFQDENSLVKMDKLCEKLNMNRAQVLRLLFSGNV
ncbi:MAG TPA: hypothetical protein VFC84_09440 [Desulfosporosinus sp.]|nr:hypothetical protein [Desulfosporosinus sp.]